MKEDPYTENNYYMYGFILLLKQINKISANTFTQF